MMCTDSIDALLTAALVDLRDEPAPCCIMGGHTPSYGMRADDGWVCELHAYQEPARAVRTVRLRELEHAYMVGDTLIGKAWVIATPGSTAIDGRPLTHVIAVWSPSSDRKRICDSEPEAIEWLLGEWSGVREVAL